MGLVEAAGKVRQPVSVEAQRARDAYSSVLGEYRQVFQQRYFAGGFAPEPPPLDTKELELCQRLVSAGERLLRAEGVAFEPCSDGLQIVPGTQSPLNRAAQRSIADGASVLFSPARSLLDMSAGKFANAENTTILGPDALLETPFSGTLNHELGHQRSWARLMRGEADLFYAQSRSLDGNAMLGLPLRPEYAFYQQLDEVPQFMRDSLFHAVKLRQSTTEGEAAEASTSLRQSLGNASSAIKQQVALFRALNQALAEESPALRVAFFESNGLSASAVLGNTQFMLPINGSFADVAVTPEKIAALRREIDTRLVILERLYEGVCVAAGALIKEQRPPDQVHRDVVNAAREAAQLQREGRSFLIREAQASSANPDALWR